MMKKLYILALFFGIASIASAQQISQKTQFHLNKFSFNPAIAGSVDHIPIMVNVRQQWVGIDDAPASQTFSVHAFTGKSMGMGLLLYNDVAGPARSTGANISAARHFQLKKTDRNHHSWLSVGMGASFYTFTVDAEKLTTDPDETRNDPAIDRLLAENSKLSTDLSFGVYLTHTEWFAGISVANLIQTDRDIFTESLNPNNLKRTYYVMGGYKYDLNQTYAIEPSTLIKGTQSGVVQADILLKGFYQKHYLGFSYRTSDAVAILLGLSVDKSLEFGYSYDITTSNLSNYNNGTHEFTLVFNLFEPISREGRVRIVPEKRNNKKRRRN